MIEILKKIQERYSQEESRKKWNKSYVSIFLEIKKDWIEYRKQSEYNDGES